MVNIVKMGTKFTNNIRDARAQKKITQEDLAAATGVTRQTIISIEKGNYVPSVLLAIRLAKSLDKAVEELFYEELA